MSQLLKNTINRKQDVLKFNSSLKKYKYFEIYIQFIDIISKIKTEKIWYKLVFGQT